MRKGGSSRAEEDRETHTIVKVGVLRATTRGDPESLFLSQSLIEELIPGTPQGIQEELKKRASIAEGEQQFREEIVAWFENEIEAMRAAEAHMNRRYSMWCGHLVTLKPRLRRQLTDKKSGAVAWEAYEYEIMVLKSQAFIRWRFFDVKRYSIPKALESDDWMRMWPTKIR